VLVHSGQLVVLIVGALFIIVHPSQKLLRKTNNNNHPVHIHPVSVGMMMMLLLLFFCHRKCKRKKKPEKNSLTIFSKKIEKSPKKEVECFINK
jgi:p-aminobenzoyl-glutamate transporter AbgT